jgi:hypothetical protein
MFYIENKGEISEDLLSDFKDPENSDKFVKPKNLGKSTGLGDNSKPEKAVIVKEEGMLSEMDYLFGTSKNKKEKIVDVRSDMDFPTLANEIIPPKKHHKI